MEWPNLDWKDGIVPLVVAVIGVAGVLINGYFERRKKENEEEAERLEVLSKAKVDFSQGQDLTARFQTLMDGYESRIRDITTDLVTARAELRDLGKEFDTHKDRCRRCPYLQGLEPSDA